MARVLIPNMEIECALRLVVACICGALIGFERTKRYKGAGIRTHMIVALGAALFVVVSQYGFNDVVWQDGVQVDVARIACNVVTGVSFLGAGLINTRGDSISGLTTAAGIWVVAAIGLAVGSGLYVLGVFGTLFILLMQWILHRRGFIAYDALVTSRVVVNMEDDPKAFKQFLDVMKKHSIKVDGNHIKRHKDMTLTYTLDVHMPRHLASEDILAIVKECDFVKSLEM